MTDLFTDLTSRLVSHANPHRHLYEHRYQMGFTLQVLPQCSATAVPQGSPDLTVPVLVVGFTGGILQQPDNK